MRQEKSQRDDLGEFNWLYNLPEFIPNYDVIWHIAQIKNAREVIKQQENLVGKTSDELIARVSQFWDDEEIKLAKAGVFRDEN
jgi:hypothetical protein